MVNSMFAEDVNFNGLSIKHHRTSSQRLLLCEHNKTAVIPHDKNSASTFQNYVLTGFKLLHRSTGFL